jgi:hypothetical protein
MIMAITIIKTLPPRILQADGTGFKIPVLVGAGLKDSDSRTLAAGILFAWGRVIVFRPAERFRGFL